MTSLCRWARSAIHDAPRVIHDLRALLTQPLIQPDRGDW